MVIKQICILLLILFFMRKPNTLKWIVTLHQGEDWVLRHCTRFVNSCDQSTDFNKSLRGPWISCLCNKLGVYSKGWKFQGNYNIILNVVSHDKQIGTNLKGFAKIRWPMVTKLVFSFDIKQASEETLQTKKHISKLVPIQVWW